MRFASWPIAVATLTLCCASGRGPEQPPLDAGRVRSIERGVTTQEEIERWFGSPSDLQVRSTGATLWRYERRWRELERPGRVRSALCSSFGWLPVIQIPVLWFADCREIVRQEELEVTFTPEQVVLAFEFSEDVVADDGRVRRRYPYPHPYPYPGPYPGPYPVPVPLEPVADASRR